jgi:hypothetical protein
VNYEPNNGHWSIKHYNTLEKIIILAILLCGAIFFISCGPAANTKLDDLGPEANGARFKVTRVGVFKDTVAYNDKRGIYILKDLKTGKEYLGISGIGISEVGAHGKGIADER